MQTRALALRQRIVLIRKQLIAHKFEHVRHLICNAKHLLQNWVDDKHRLTQRLEILKTLQQEDDSSQDEASLTRVELTKSTEFVKNFYINHEMGNLPENHMVLFPQESAHKYLQNIFRDKQLVLRR